MRKIQENESNQVSSVVESELQHYGSCSGYGFGTGLDPDPKENGIKNKSKNQNERPKFWEIMLTFETKILDKILIFFLLC